VPGKELTGPVKAEDRFVSVGMDGDAGDDTFDDFDHGVSLGWDQRSFAVAPVSWACALGTGGREA
jgi:hypothetical protein